jgi:hypothetical protein
MTQTASDGTDAPLAQARARALASTVRMRILRICLHEPHTNKEIAAVLGLNPGSTLHHVRTLVETGFLRAEEPRRGTRGAREVPYRATGLSWSTPVPGISSTLINTFLEETRGLDPDEIDVARLGLKLNGADREELLTRIRDLLIEFKERPTDTDGEPLSIMIAVHPDRQAR